MTDATMNGGEGEYEEARRQEPAGEEMEEKCDEVLADAVEEKPGIYHVDFDPEHGEVSFAYDPRLVGEDDVALVAQEVAPTLQERWAKCTMRLDRRGGRGCEACALALEDRLHQIPGVRRATVSYMGGAMSIAYDDQLLSPEDLWREVRAQGVDARPSAAVRRPEPAPEEGLGARLRAAFNSERVELAFTIITLLGMVVGFVAERAGASPTLITAAYVAAYVTGGAYGLQAGLQSLRELTIDVDLLMILAALGAALVGAPFEGAMLLFLFSLSNVLQNYALDRTRNAIRSLMALRPEEALVRRGDELVTLPIEEIDVGDHIVVRPGERIALDGVVVEGESSVDQSSITGESMPVPRQEGDRVLAGTINQKGSLELSVTHLAKESTIAKLIQLVEEAHSEKAQTQRFIDRAEQYYAVGVLVLTGLAIVVPIFLLQEAFEPAFYRAMTLMVAASPCALVISTPATVLSAIGNGARQGVLFKGGVYVEQAAEIKVVAFDKTGTLTRGEPQVTDVVALNGAAEDEMLRLAAAVEARSEHPLAQAITTAAEARGLAWTEVDAFQSDTGRGVAARVNGGMIAVGNRRYFDGYDLLDGDNAGERLETLQSEGKTAVMVARVEAQEAHVVGLIGIADVLRPEAAEVVRALKERGVERVVMLTGDNERVARAIAEEAGVDAYHADLLPEDKMRILKEEERHGLVAMVGDGVNDAPALATASIGIAMGAAGTDVALETADIVLMADDLTKIPYVIGLSRQTRKTLWQNLVFAIGVIIVLVGAVLGVGLTLPLSVIGHEGSTVIVSLNGLRLLAYRDA
ncbi:MAG TPA: heavy metal translocating P-type ATPase [Candidatus Sulfomarinibacteraceae bacterium]|nr:heavy metal translocating P-type ATPase [Candidatus Sulfomarinibacteraceae bacterium]